MPLTVLIGGARSGKSALAVDLAAREGGPVVFVATAEARDDEMSARIAAHRTARPPEWQTVEAPLDVGAAFAEVERSACVVLDCLTLWVANLMAAGRDAEAEAAKVAEAAAARPALTIAVSNEVGSGIVPADPSTRRFRDVLGAVNRTWVAHAHRALLMVAGRALPLMPPEVALGE